MQSRLLDKMDDPLTPQLDHRSMSQIRTLEDANVDQYEESTKWMDYPAEHSIIELLSDEQTNPVGLETPSHFYNFTTPPTTPPTMSQLNLDWQNIAYENEKLSKHSVDSGVNPTDTLSATQDVSTLSLMDKDEDYSVVTAVDDEFTGDYEIENIVGHETIDGQLHYCVEWKCTWVRSDEITNQLPEGFVVGKCASDFTIDMLKDVSVGGYTVLALIREAIIDGQPCYLVRWGQSIVDEDSISAPILVAEYTDKVNNSL